jgi:hypothetical protein
MPTRIFRVDLSDGARDFKPVATEPGLPMLDRANGNFALLHRWLGSYAAEPVWIGDDSINVFIVGDEGRLEKVDCVPVSKADLEGPLSQDLKTLQARIKKAKPESATEQSLHRVVRQTVAQQTNDLDAGNFEGFFFKYKRGKDWKLLWCWGYQRTDAEPVVASVCTNPECHQLFVKRTSNKNRCPGCDEVPTARRGGAGAGGVGGLFASRWVQIGGLAALALLALLLFFVFGSKSQLVVSPSELTGPAGSRIDYKILSKRFFVLSSDVTDKTQAALHDIKLVEFAPEKHYALAKRPGKTVVEFEHSGNKIKADISIGAPATPKSIVIEPKELTIAVGETKELTATGYYEGDVKIDLTDFADWEVVGGKVGFCNYGRVESFEPGKSEITAKYRGNASDKHAVASVPLEVILPPGTLAVSPSNVNLAIDEVVSLEIAAADSAPVVVESSDPKIVEVQAGNKIVGRGTGLAEITVRQGNKVQSVTARVRDTPYKSLQIIPSTIALKTGEAATFKVMGRTAGGKDIEIPAKDIIWIKQPIIDNADVDRDKLAIYGLTPTTSPQDLVVQVGESLTAIAKVEVGKGSKPITTIDGPFVAHPPIKVGKGSVVVDPGYFGKGLVFEADGGLIVNEIETGSVISQLGIPKGAIITGVDGRAFRGSGITAVKEYLAANPLRKGARIQYLDPTTKRLEVLENTIERVAITDVGLVGVKAVDLSAADFQAELTLRLRERAEYRAYDNKDTPLSEWATHGPDATVTITTGKIQRVADDDYDLWVHRKIGETVKKFQIPFKLKAQ